MNTIYKYAIPETGDLELLLPREARPLHAERQGAEWCLWVLLDPDFTQPDMVIRRFVVHGTGHGINKDPEKMNHISTFLDGPFVWHVFEYLAP